MKIRKSKPEDIKEIIALDHVVKYEPERKLFIIKSVKSNNCYVVVVDKRPIGYSVLEYTFFGCGFVSMLYLKEEYRRRGIGEKLMMHLESKCKTKKLFTSTNKSNKPMQKLMKKMKYIESGIIHNLDPGDPELIYYKKITHN